MKAKINAQKITLQELDSSVESSPKKKKRRKLRLSLIILVTAFVIFSYSFINEIMRYHELSQSVDYYKTQLAAAEDKYMDMQEKKALHFNEEYLERLARKNLGMIKEGEILIYPIEKNNELIVVDKNSLDDDIH